jgi:hypothetical protein
LNSSTVRSRPAPARAALAGRLVEAELLGLDAGRLAEAHAEGVQRMMRACSSPTFTASALRLSFISLRSA